MSAQIESDMVRHRELPSRRHVNPFMPNGISHHYQLGEFFSGLRDVGSYFFYFHSNLKKNICKQTVENLIRRRLLRRLV